MNQPSTSDIYLGRYDAANPDTRRKNQGSRIKTSDQLLSPTKRNVLIESARDLRRNYALAAWAINKHLDYVSSFSFYPRTGNEALDKRLAELMNWYSRPMHCDIAGKYSLSQMIRMVEACRVVDGDVFLVKLRNGRLQGIEADRVRNNTRAEEDDLIHGCKIGAGGKLLSANIYKRTTMGLYEFERTVPASRLIHVGYFSSFDQVRGISPLTSAIATFQDSLEVMEYARMKAKVSQLFALAITRESAGFGMEETENYDGDYDIDFNNGPVVMHMDPGDKADFLESRNPSTEFQSFVTLVNQVALKALDIPWSFFDESFGNYNGSRLGVLQYEKSCKAKREDLKFLLDRITLWRLGMFIMDGVLQLPQGMELKDVKWEWLPTSTIPWIDPKKEIEADILAVQMGLRTRSEIRKERYGDNWIDLVPELGKENQLLQEQGLISDLPSVDTPASGNPLKDQMETYGVAVRAGAITPQLDDEVYFRQQFGLPAINPNASTSWNKSPYRSPVTLKDSEGNVQPTG